MKKKKILVVDNHPVMLKFMTNLLEKEGHDVKTAEAGLSALDILKTYIPDVIFIDLIMPHISGDKLCRIIRSMPKMKYVYLIILSAIATEEATDFVEFGANACIAKGPFNKMAKHVLATLDQLDLATSSDFSEKTIGFEDISQRQITRELLSSKRHSEAILDNMSEGILELTLKGKIIYANPAAVSLTGIPEEKLLASNFTELFHETHRKRIKELLKVTGDTPQTISEESPVILNGKQVSLSIVPVKDEEHGSIAVILDDITEHKQAEEALRESEEKYRDIFENVSDFLYFHDLDGNLIDTNLAWKKEYGFSDDDLAHLNLRDLIPERYRNQFDDYLKRVKENGKDEGIIRVMTKDGRERIVEYRNSLVYESTGPIKVRGSARDLTERKKTEETLRKAAALETLSSVLENFIGDSLSNLLMPVYGQIELCEIRDSIEQIKSELGYMKGGFTKLLTGISAYRKFTKAGESSLGKISSEGISSILGPLLSGQPLKTYGNGEFPIDPSVKLRFTYDPKQKGALSWEELPSVVGSKLAIETALQETLINAVESYDPKKGGDVQVSARKEDDNLIIKIADNGRGMSNEERDKSQLPFFKVLGVKGSDRFGLGAYVALESVKYCGGDIHIESTEGAGTTASISFKVSDWVS